MPGPTLKQRRHLTRAHRGSAGLIWRAQAHAPDLFACGVAKSGAYNRTLTPFGFQAEERTLWQATDVYMQMSPFLNVRAPLLERLSVRGACMQPRVTAVLTWEMQQAAGSMACKRIFKPGRARRLTR